VLDPSNGLEALGGVVMERDEDEFRKEPTVHVRNGVLDFDKAVLGAAGRRASEWRKTHLPQSL